MENLEKKVDPRCNPRAEAALDNSEVRVKAVLLMVAASFAEGSIGLDFDSNWLNYEQ